MNKKEISNLLQIVRKEQKIQVSKLGIDSRKMCSVLFNNNDENYTIDTLVQVLDAFGFELQIIKKTSRIIMKCNSDLQPITDYELLNGYYKYAKVMHWGSDSEPIYLDSNDVTISSNEITLDCEVPHTQLSDIILYPIVIEVTTSSNNKFVFGLDKGLTPDSYSVDRVSNSAFKRIIAKFTRYKKQ